MIIGPAALVGIVLGAALAPAGTPAPTVAVAVVPAAQLTTSSRAALAVPDRTAAGGRALRLDDAVTARGAVTLSAVASRVVLRVRAARCHGSPEVRLALDGRTVLRRRVENRRYASFPVSRPVAAGAHRVGVSLAKPLTVRGCRRRLYVDGLSFRGEAVAAPPGAPSPAPEPASGPAPASGVAPPNGAAPAPTPPPAPVAPPLPAAGVLRWAPPALSAPTAVTVPDGDQWLDLDRTKDYTVRLVPALHQGVLGIRGGRNVVVIGGQVRLPSSSTEVSAVQVRDNAGTVHLEGLWIDGSSGHNADGIRIASPASTVQIENVRVSGLLGAADGAHADVIQPYGGVRDLRVDHLSGDSNYQGIFAMPDLGPIGQVELSDVDLAYDDVGAADGGYLLWLTNGCSGPVTTLSNVYIKPSRAKTFGTSIWPNVYAAHCPAKLSGSTASWPSLPVTGHVTAGTPPGGSYVSAQSVAAGTYTSPGYATGP